MTKYLSSSYQEQFAYLPYIVIFMLILFLSLSCLMGALFNFKKPFSKKPKRRGDKYERMGHEGCCELLCLYCYGMFCCCCGCWKDLLRSCCCGLEIGRPLIYFEVIYDSHCYIIGMLLLVLFRFAAFAAMVYYDIYLVAVDDSNSPYRFGNWVNVVVTVYFIVAAMLSTWGIKTRLLCGSHDDERIKWPALWERLAVAALLLYEVAFVNTLFIMVVQLVYFSDAITFDNFKRHIAPFLGMFIDYLFNIEPVRMEHYGYTLLLPMLYLIMQWVLVYTGNLHWQYTFFYVTTSRSFMKYSILVGVHLACHVTISLLHTLRDRVVCGMSYADRHRAEEPEEEIEIDIENAYSYPEFSDSRRPNDLEDAHNEELFQPDHAENYPRPDSTVYYEQEMINQQQLQQMPLEEHMDRF